MEKVSPCDWCFEIGSCKGCVLNRKWKTRGQCNKTECMCHDEFGCILSLDNICKASNQYESGDYDK